MNRSLLSRRETLLSEISKGRKLQDVAEGIILNSGVTEAEARERLLAAINKDWQNRDKWIPQIIRLQDPSLLSDIVSSIRTIKPEAWKIYADAESSPSDRNAALRTILKTEAVLADILLKTGFIKSAPTQIEATVNLATIPFKASPELQALLAAERVKQEKEKLQREAIEAEQKRSQ